MVLPELGGMIIEDIEPGAAIAICTSCKEVVPVPMYGGLVEHSVHYVLTPAGELRRYHQGSAAGPGGPDAAHNPPPGRTGG